MTSSLPDSSGGCYALATGPGLSSHADWIVTETSELEQAICSMSGGQEITPEPEEPDDAVTLCREVFDEASEPTDKGGEAYLLFTSSMDLPSL